MSYKSIQELKKNMRKVPAIQAKSIVYHAKEKEKADELLQEALQSKETHHSYKQNISSKDRPNKHRRTQRKSKIKHFFYYLSHS